MSISYPLTLPQGYHFSAAQITEQNVGSRNTSPFSQQEQIYMHDGDRWYFAVSFPSMTAYDARDYLAFFSSLRGPLGTFYLRDPNFDDPRGVASGTPIVAGASQTGYTVNTSGWTHGITGILKAGDMIQVDTGYHRVLKDVNSDGSGNATLDIWPQLRAPANSAAIVVTNAKGIFRLDGQGYTYNVSKAGTYDISVNCVEAL